MNTAGRKLHEKQPEGRNKLSITYEISCSQTCFTEEDPEVQRAAVTFPSSTGCLAAEPGLGPVVLFWDVGPFTFIHFFIKFTFKKY